MSERSMSVIAAALGCPLLLLASTESPATTNTWWLYNTNTDFDFANGDNWNNGIAEGDSPYITTGPLWGAEELPPIDEPEWARAVFNSGTDQDPFVVGNLYVGGWDVQFDTFAGGNPALSAGTLDIVGGVLETIDTAGSPPCAYMRNGFRGARGTVNQSGGEIRSCTQVSMSYKSINATSIWNMTGGKINAYGIDVGGQGFGFLDMTGGEVTNTFSDANCDTSTDCTTHIGRGFDLSETNGFVPGFGVISQIGGRIENEVVQLGEHPGSAGFASLRGIAELYVTKRLMVGNQGLGALTIGGIAQVVVGSTSVDGVIYVGRNPGGYGQISIHDGTLTQIGSSTGLIIGKVNNSGGWGQLAITGRGADISVEGAFVVYGGSKLTVYYDGNESGTDSVIQVGGAAQFYSGSELRIEYSNGYEPAQGNYFDVVCAVNGVTVSGTVKTPYWEIEEVPNQTCEGGQGEILRLVYCPSGGC